MVTTSDIGVIGGGPAGCVLAARLAQFGLSVCLVERVRFPRRQLGESLSPGVLPLLASVGAGPAIEKAGYPRVSEVRVHWEKEVVRNDPAGQGMLVDRGDFDRLLLDHARECGVRIFQPATIHEMKRREGGWRVAVADASGTTQLDVRLIADAAGRAGVLPRRRRRTGPRTVALHAYWSGAGLPCQPQIEAGDSAWFWGVPLLDGLYNTLVFLDPRDLRRMPGPLAAKFHQLLSASSILPAASGARLMGEVHATDATPYLDEECVTDDSIKVGDAALAIDPLSSSGVQKAIQGALAGSVVVNTLLHRPPSRTLAQRFYRESLSESSTRHRAWACQHYGQVAAIRPARFWQERAAGATTMEAPPSTPGTALPADARLQLSPDVEFVATPCVVDRFVEARSAVRAAAPETPVAYLGEVELAPLLRCVRPGMTARELVQAWLPRVPLAKGVALLQWLTARSFLVPAGAGERSSR